MHFCMEEINFVNVWDKIIKIHLCDGVIWPNYLKRLTLEIQSVIPASKKEICNTAGNFSKTMINNFTYCLAFNFN